MSEHTPGPWQVVTKAVGYRDDNILCIVWGPNGPGYGAVAHTAPYTVPNSRQMADARLIAAAPDMLAMLHFLHEELAQWGYGDGPVTKKIAELIARAEGRQPETEPARPEPGRPQSRS